jgi:hypothetical protein
VPLATQEDHLRRQIDRLYEQERQERDERRGLEQRAATTVGATVVALGLIFSAATSNGFDFGRTGDVMVIIGAVLTIFGMVGLTLGLSGAHTTKDFSIRQAIARTKSNAVARITVEPQPLTEEWVDGVRDKVETLVERNARLVPLLRLASVMLGFGVYMALAGLAAGVLN